MVGILPAHAEVVVCVVPALLGSLPNSYLTIKFVPSNITQVPMVPSPPSASSLASAGDAVTQRPSESSTPVEEDSSTGDYSKVTLKDVEVHSREIENDGERVDEDYVTILGRDGATFKSKEIRTMCKLLGV